MKPLVLVTLIATLLTACGGQPPTATQPDQVEVTRLVEVEVTRLVETEVEVTRLVETVVTTTPPPTPPPPPTAEIDPTAYLATANITPDDLPQGDPGLVVVLAGPPGTFGVVPIVIRNNTDTPAYNIELSATARDAAGAILGTARGDDITPSYVPPGGVAIGRVLFQDTPIDGANIEYNITSAGGPGFIFTRRDLVIEEHQLVNGNVVGLSMNNHSTALNLTKVIVMCFDDDLIPSAVRFDFTDQDRVEAGAELPFSVDLLGDEAKCSRYLIAGSGRETD